MEKKFDRLLSPVNFDTRENLILSSKIKSITKLQITLISPLRKLFNFAYYKFSLFIFYSKELKKKKKLN